MRREPGWLKATAGDDDELAFRSLVDQHCGSLHAHCYRMLGSLHDAEDAYQETLLRAWRGLARMEGRSSLRTWLHRIATNVCLDAIARRPTRVLPIDYGPATAPDGTAETARHDVAWIDPYPDAHLGVPDGREGPEARYERRESLELAFIAALQHLPALQRAALISREVLGLSTREVAESLDTTEASVKSALQRARKAIDDRLPQQSQQATLRALGDTVVRSTVGRFVTAFEEGDVEAIVAMLAEDVTFQMPPYTEWCRGRDAVAKSWLMPGGPPPRLRYVPARANGHLAVGTYQLDAGAGRYLPIALDVITLGGPLISEIVAFRSPELYPVFGLPEALAA